MAKCDEGYRCEVCGVDVEHVLDSDLYLRYILGEVPLERLHLHRERHIRCNPALAQYIKHERFEPVIWDSPFAKERLDPVYVSDRTEVVTRAWLRLQSLPRRRLALPEYPLSFTPFDPKEDVL